MNHEQQTTRLLLRPCGIENLEVIYQLWINDHVRHFLFDDRVISKDEARSFVEASIENFAQHGYGLWLVYTIEGESLIGFAGFLRSVEDVPNLIYGIHPDFCGRGYATEAAAAVMSYALESLTVPRVTAEVDEPNVSSIRVVEKLGMRRTGRTIVAGRPLVNYDKARSQIAGTKPSTVVRVTLLALMCVLMTTVACKEAGEVKWEYVVPDDYEGFLAIRFDCPGGQSLIKDGVARVEFRSDGTFCTSYKYTPTWERTWLPTLRRSPHQSASGKPIEQPVETPNSGYVLCCEVATHYCVIFPCPLGWQYAAKDINFSEAKVRFLYEHFDLPNCSRPN